MYNKIHYKLKKKKQKRNRDKNNLCCVCVFLLWQFYNHFSEKRTNFAYFNYEFFISVNFQ